MAKITKTKRGGGPKFSPKDKSNRHKTNGTALTYNQDHGWENHPRLLVDRIRSPNLLNRIVSPNPNLLDRIQAPAHVQRDFQAEAEDFLRNNLPKPHLAARLSEPKYGYDDYEEDMDMGISSETEGGQVADSEETLVVTQATVTTKSTPESSPISVRRPGILIDSQLNNRRA